jgi:uncharacterized membrane protein affecting hemolysin expression
MWGFRAEPAAVAELFRLVMFLAIAFGWVQWSDSQQGTVLAVVSAVLTLFVRQNVTTQVTLEKAGVTQAQVAAVAESPTKILAEHSTHGTV